MRKAFAIVSLCCALTVATPIARAQGDKPPPEVVLETKFVEVFGEYRNFPNWKAVSGDDPAVVAHEAGSSAGGLGLNVGFRLGGIPLWAQLGGYASSGLSTNTTLANGDHIHGKINDYGVGGGVRVMPYKATRTAMFLWAMGYYDRNDGNFDITDGSKRSENRIHSGWIGDYGIGAMYLIDPMIGVEVGISYSGSFDKKNADENLRFRLGMILNPPGANF
jgi:hypothetical protein